MDGHHHAWRSTVAPFSIIVSCILEVGKVDNRLNVMLPKVIMKKPDNANDIVRMVVVVVVIMILVTMTITSRC